MTFYSWVFKLPWKTIQDAAKDNNVPANLLAAIAQTESSGNHYACRFEKNYKYIVSAKTNAVESNITETTEMILQMTSWGLCQIMGGVARELGLKGSLLQLVDPSVNLVYAAKLLKKLAGKHSERNDIISAYNAGTPIKGLDGKYKNQGYVDQVNAYLSVLEQMQRG